MPFETLLAELNCCHAALIRFGERDAAIIQESLADSFTVYVASSNPEHKTLVLRDQPFEAAVRFVHDIARVTETDSLLQIVTCF